MAILPKKAEFFLMRKITSKRIMDRIVNSKANAIGKTAIKGSGSLFISPGQEALHTKQLKENGYSVLDMKLDEARVKAIVEYSEKISCFDHYHDATKPVDVKHPPAETHVAHYKREELVQMKEIMDVANDPGVLKSVQDFLGARPTISNVNLWWSFGGKQQAEHAQLFHRDMDDWRFCKLFVYLTDVSPKAGPHIYVRNSSQSPKLRKIRRYSDKEIEDAFGKENVMSFTAPKGTSFLVDTYGFHKGLLPESEDRLLLQIQYSLFPIGIEEYKPVSMPGSTYDPYINRLLIK